MKPQTILFDPAKHEYTTPEGERVPSVTEILQGLHNFSAISPATLEYAARRGTDVHSATEQLDMDIDPEDIEELDEETAPYVNAYLAWKRDYNPKILYAEHPVYHRVHGFAGTVDRIVSIGGAHYIIDLKTTSGASREQKIIWSAQLAAYKIAAFFGIGISCATAVLHLRKDGTYRFYEVNDIEDKYCFDSEDLFWKMLQIYNTMKGRTQ